MAAGTKVDLLNVTYSHIPCQINLVLGTMAMSQTFGGGSGGMLEGLVIWFCV